MNLLFSELKKVSLWLLLVVLGLSQSAAQIVNWANKYNKHSLINLRSKVALKDSVAFIYLEVEVKEGLNIDTLQIGYSLAEDYGQPLTNSTPLAWKDKILARDGQKYYLKFEFPVTYHKILILTFSYPAEGANLKFDIVLYSFSNFGYTDLLLWDEDRGVPHFSSFIGINQKIRVLSLKGDVDTAFVFHYQTDFPPADPPMVTAGRVSKGLKIDSTFTVPVNAPLTMPKEGLYFLQRDTATLSGLSFLVMKPSFPRVNRVSQMIDPLIYISKSDEIAQLRASEDQKKALDKYFLDLTKSREKAKLLVRSYYKRFEESNHFFTHYKEGWKTDKGMIYMIFGPPINVQVTQNSEVWTYLREVKIIFNFRKVKNIFTQDHFKLIRDPKFDQIWFSEVERWRKAKLKL